MSLIIAGRFQTFPKAEAAAQRLFARGFLEEDVTLFYVAPSGQHGLTGGDHYADASAQEVSKGAGKGVTIGAVLGAIVGAAVAARSSGRILPEVVGDDRACRQVRTRLTVDVLGTKQFVAGGSHVLNVEDGLGHNFTLNV